MQLTPRNTLLFMVMIAVAVFAETSLPYWLAENNAPNGYVFSGQVAYAPDQNMYFSFISQARDGAFLFKNKLTAITLNNEPVFLNLEYWLIGTVQRLSGLSENAVYQVWRLLGIIWLAFGFARLASVTLRSERRRLAAFALFFFTGGFGFLFAFLGKMGLLPGDLLQAGIIDARYGIFLCHMACCLLLMPFFWRESAVMRPGSMCIPGLCSRSSGSFVRTILFRPSSSSPHIYLR
jgi:hypothetical protein